jgi:hypothetical protein
VMHLFPIYSRTCRCTEALVEIGAQIALSPVSIFFS